MILDTVADSMTIWSSLSEEFIRRNEERAGVSYRRVDVETVPFQDVLDKYGVPFYLKVDIEGYDMLCVNALHGYDRKPAFLSIESQVSSNKAPADAVLDEIAQLWTLGYRRFRYVNQARGRPPAPFETEQGWQTGPRSLAVAQLLRLHHNFGGFGGRWSGTRPARAYNRASRALGRPAPWYDLQAALP